MLPLFCACRVMFFLVKRVYVVRYSDEEDLFSFVHKSQLGAFHSVISPV